MMPKKAVETCEADIECAGFTYSGAKNVGQEFYIYFFRYVASPSISVSAINNDEKVWTTYRVKRSFVVISGRNEMKKDSVGKPNIIKNATLFCNNVLSSMGIQKDEKRISLSNKIRWTLPDIKAITIDPFSDEHPSEYINEILEIYKNKDALTLQNLSLSPNQSKWLTILRLNPPIEDMGSKNSGITSVIFIVNTLVIKFLY